MNKRIDWNREKISKLIDCWNLGYSATQVAKALGIEKNHVLGKIYRLRHHPGWSKLIMRPPDYTKSHTAASKQKVQEDLQKEYESAL
jgi:hypothetical protein